MSTSCEPGTLVSKVGLFEKADLQGDVTVTLWREKGDRLRLRVDTPSGFVELVRGGVKPDDLMTLVQLAEEKVAAPGLRAWARQTAIVFWCLWEGVVL